MGKFIFGVVSFFLFSTAAWASRTTLLPRQAVTAYESGEGSPRGFHLNLEISCVNLDPNDSQDVDATISYEVFDVKLLIANPSGITGWNDQGNGWRMINSSTNPALITFVDPRPLTKTLPLTKLGTANDHVTIGFNVQCVFTKSGVLCDNDQSIFQPAPTGKWNLNAASFATAIGTGDCSPGTTTIENCVKKARVGYEMVPRLVARSDRGAVICSSFLSSGLLYARNQVTGELNAFFNGGRPF